MTEDPAQQLLTNPDARFEAVWLHGWGQDHRAMMPLAHMMAPHLDSRILDLPGFGGTAPLAPGAGSGDYAQWLADTLGPNDRPRVLIGHSFGVRVAIQFAAAYPDRVDAIVVIAGAGIPRRRTLGWKVRAQALRLLGRAARATDRVAGTQLGEAYAARFGSADYRAAGVLRGTLVSVVNENLTDTARKVKAPVLLLYGAQDEATPPEVGERFAAALPRSTLHILPGFGHLDILSRGAHQCQNLITRFLDGLD